MGRNPLKLPEAPNSLSTTARFFIGVAVGIVYLALSFGVAAIGEKLQPGPAAAQRGFGGLIAFQMLAGIALCFVPGWKPFGAGMLASLPLSGMIFVTLCFGAVILFSH